MFKLHLELLESRRMLAGQALSASVADWPTEISPREMLASSISRTSPVALISIADLAGAGVASPSETNISNLPPSESGDAFV